jgi:hypothetical protein
MRVIMMMHDEILGKRIEGATKEESIHFTVSRSSGTVSATFIFTLTQDESLIISASSQISGALIIYEYGKCECYN